MENRGNVVGIRRDVKGIVQIVLRGFNPATLSHFFASEFPAVTLKFETFVLLIQAMNDEGLNQKQYLDVQQDIVLHLPTFAFTFHVVKMTDGDSYRIVNLQISHPKDSHFPEIVFQQENADTVGLVLTYTLEQRRLGFPEDLLEHLGMDMRLIPTEPAE